MNGTVDSITTDWRGDTLTAPAALGRTVFVTTANGSPAITAPPGAFSALDVGRSVTGTGIPVGAAIDEVFSDTSANLSANATATGSTTSTLGAAVTVFVGDTSDFDEDGGWLTIADSVPFAYLTADEDAATITLATPVDATYATGEPVNVWDPTVLPAGAKVVEYVASVMTDRGAVPATIPHSVVPLAGVDRLIGASVSLDEDDDGDWYVAQVYGRESSVEQSYIDVPFITFEQAVDVPWASSATYAPMTDWTITDVAPGFFTYDAATGKVTAIEGGVYQFGVAITWQGNSSNRRYVELVKVRAGVEKILRGFGASPPDADPFTQQITVLAEPVLPGDTFYVHAHQTSGLTLDIDGDRPAVFQIVRAQA